MLKEGERLEDLGGGVSAIVSKSFGFGADAVLLADFSAPKKGSRACDLGTGCGIIPLLWLCAGHGVIADAVELQPQAAELAGRAMELNGAPVTVHCADLRALPPAFTGAYDLVACNPPYFSAGAGKSAGTQARAEARHELTCTFADVAQAAAKLLRPGGRLCVCLRPERLPEMTEALRSRSLEPKRLRLVQHDAHTKPFLALVEGRLGARPGLAVLPVLLATQNGEMSPEMRAIYGENSAGAPRE